jgi:hypothetical protein
MGGPSIRWTVCGCCNKVSGTGRTPSLAQADETRLGSWLHGIVHMAEPDEINSRYWYRAAGWSFPVMGALTNEMAEFERAYESELPW